MINSTTSTTSTDRTAYAAAIAAPGKAPVSAPTPRGDQLSTESAIFLRAELGRQPEIRPEVVERARAIISDPHYPSRETLKGVAALILSSADLSEDQS